MQRVAVSRRIQTTSQNIRNRSQESHRVLPRRTAPLVVLVAMAIACILHTSWMFGQASANQAAAALPKGIQLVTSVEGITEYRLDNGMHVLLFPDPSKPTMTVNMTILVGSGQEGYGEKGMAHLLEHMLFKGSTNHTNIAKELSEHGTRPNGTTSYDRTNYFETFQATDENLRWALEMEADRMVNSFIAKKDLDTEMTVVRNEFEAGENSPQNILLQRVISSAYLWHNYGHSTIGARSDVENVPIERLQAFYHTFYQPDNAMLLVAGRIDEGKTLALVNNTFGRIPAPARTLQKIYTAEPVQDGERFVTLRRVGDVQAVVAGYHVPAGSHADFGAVNILTQILTDQPSGRLYKALVETKKASSVFGFNFQLKDPGMALFGAQVRTESSLPAARDALLETLDAVTAAPVTKEEVERARQTLLRNIELNLTNSETLGLTLSTWMGMGDWRLFFLNRDRIRKATVDDVQRVAAVYLKPANRTVGTYIPTAKPDRSDIPATPDVAQMLKDYKGETQLAVGEAFDASPANIEARVKRMNLPNGMKVALLPKKTRGGVVVVSAALRYGDEKSLSNHFREAQFTGEMLMRGTTAHTRQQIKDEFERLKSRVNVSGGSTQASVSAETIRENLVPVLKLLTEVLRSPSFPETEFDQLKQQQLTQIENLKSEPQFIAFNAFSRHLNPYPKGDVRYVSNIEEQLEETKATTLESVKRFYAEFYGASNAQLSVVGDFDDKEVSHLIGDLLGSWKSPKPFTRVPAVYHDVPALAQSFETPDKANAMFIAGMNLNVRDDDPDYPALTLGNYILGSGLNSRLFQRIRQKEGLSYGVGSSLSASPLDKSGTFVGNAIYAPQNAEKVEAAFKDEIAKMLKNGFTTDEIKTAKSGWLQSRQVNRAQDSSLAGTFSSYLFLNRTFAWDQELETKVSALTAEQILAAMRKFVDPSKFTIMKAGDFAKTVATK